MASVYDDPRLGAAKSEAEAASGAYYKSAEGDLKLPDMLRDALTKKFTTDNPVYAERESRLKDYLTTVTQAPLDYTHTSAGGNSNIVYNPMQQANLIQGRRASALAPITTLNDLLGISIGGLDRLIDSTSRAQQANTVKLKGVADSKRQGYTDILSELSARADEAYKQRSLDISASKGSATDTKALEKKLTAAKDLQLILDDIANARKALSKGGAGAGGLFLNIRKTIPKGWPGSISGNTSELESALATVNKSIFSTAGKALTAKEAEILAGRIPRTSNNSNIINTQLNELERDTRNRLLRLVGGDLTIGEWE